MSENKFETLFSFIKDVSKQQKNEDYKKVAAWFLGSKAENKDLFMEVLTKSINDHIKLRETYYPEEIGYIDDSIKKSEPYKAMCKVLKEKCGELSEKLTASVPFFSQNYQAHMNADTLMAGNLGYMTAMLYNQNNVATEASPVTSVLEKEVGRQLCELLGYTDKEGDKIRSWGHITADGTIANIEAMWAARNLKTYPLAIKEMICNCCSLEKAKEQLKVSVFNGIKIEEKLLVDCSSWQLMNVNIDEALQLTKKISELCFPDDDKSGDILDEMLKPYLLATKGIAFYAKKYDEFENMKVFVPVTHHYSWPKSGTLLGIGQENIVGIRVDRECKMDMACLREELENCLKNKYPVLMVVAVVGSTAEGAIDNVEDIKKIKDELAEKGLEFNFHCDAAWGGYLRSMLIEPETTVSDESLLLTRTSVPHFVPNLPLSDYAKIQYRNIHFADTITVDPHKSGYVSYAAGALCYRNENLKSMITFNASYIQSDADTNMGIYGVEGSKPGATAAAVWLAHNVVPLNQSGYGLILGECSYTTKLYYCNWIALEGKIDMSEYGITGDYEFSILPLIDLPLSITTSETDKSKLFDGQDAMMEHIQDNVINRSISEIASNEKTMRLLQNIGSDVLMNTFIVNFKKDGVMNTDCKLMNELNENIFKMFSFVQKTKEGEEVYQPKYVLMMNTLSSGQYGDAFRHIEKKWSLETAEDYKLNVLVNTILQPWPNTPLFIKKVMETFREGVASSLTKILLKEEVK